MPPHWLKANPTFTLDIPLKPRIVAAHPYTGQDIVALARGAVIYCVEDFDNSWVDDHFKSLVFDPAGIISEEAASDIDLGQSYIALTAHNAASLLDVNAHVGPFTSVDQRTEKKLDINQLHFVPYCLRDNRGGKGHMRVGIRRKIKSR